MRKLLLTTTFLLPFLLVNQLLAQCNGNLILSLGNGNDGEVLAYNSDNGLLYHGSGISAGEQFFETIDPVALTISANLVPGDTYGPAPTAQNDELTGLVWYPPMNAFIAMNRDERIYSISPTGVFTELSTFAGSSGHGYLRGFAVVGSTFYGVDAFSLELISFDPNTGAILTNVTLSAGGLLPERANGLTTHPITGDVYIIFVPNGASTSNRHLGTVDVTTGMITDLGAMGDSFAGITFDCNGKLFAVVGDGGSDDETLYSDFPCIPTPRQGVCPAPPIPTMNEWGVLIFGLLILNLGVIFLYRKEIT